MQAYEGYLEKGRFYPIEPVNIQGRRRVIITVLDDQPASEQKETAQARALREFFETVNASDEEVPAAFERINFTREVEL